MNYVQATEERIPKRYARPLIRVLRSRPGEPHRGRATAVHQTDHGKLTATLPDGDDAARLAALKARVEAQAAIEDRPTRYAPGAAVETPAEAAARILAEHRRRYNPMTRRRMGCAS